MSKDEPADDDNSLRILKNRLAKGEITIEQFNKLQDVLSNNQSLTKIKDEIKEINKKVDQIRQDKNQKSQSTTLILSIVLGLIGLLGIGHFYVSRKGKGTAFLIAGIFLALIIVLLVTAPTFLPQNPGFAKFQQSVMTVSFAAVYGLVYLGLYFVQIFDAVKSCRKYNLSLSGNKQSGGLLSNREKIFLGMILTILIILGGSAVNDISINSQKMNILKQEQQKIDQQIQYAQTLQGYNQIYQKWRECSQKAGSEYLYICGDPPPDPFTNQPVDCSLSVNHWLCNPFYTEQNGKKIPIINSTTQQTQQIQQVPQVSNTSNPSGDTAVITTKYGDIVIKLQDDVAPKTVANFEQLANSGFYDGTVFHRIVSGFVIQAGDPNTIKGPRNSWGLGTASHTIPPEFSGMQFKKYTVGMARGSDVNSGSSQFFITLGDTPWLNNQYTLFGEVVSGHDVVDKIASLSINQDSQPTDADSARIIKMVIHK